MDGEKQAIQMLMNGGVPVQLVAPPFLRFWGKKHLNFLLRLPKMDTLIRIAEKYLLLGIEMPDKLKLNDAILLTAVSAKRISEIVAISLLNRKSVFTKRLAKLLRKNLTAQQLYYFFSLIIIHGGVEDFTNTIRLIEATRITKPMNLSPQEAGS